MLYYHFRTNRSARAYDAIANVAVIACIRVLVQFMGEGRVFNETNQSRLVDLWPDVFGCLRFLESNMDLDAQDMDITNRNRRNFHRLLGISYAFGAFALYPEVAQKTFSDLHVFHLAARL